MLMYEFNQKNMIKLLNDITKNIKMKEYLIKNYQDDQNKESSKNNYEYTLENKSIKSNEKRSKSVESNIRENNTKKIIYNKIPNPKNINKTKIINNKTKLNKLIPINIENVQSELLSLRDN